MLDRQKLMKLAGMAGLETGLTSASAFALDTVTLPVDNGEQPLVKYPPKRPMIGLTCRSPQLETPFCIFNVTAARASKALRSLPMAERPGHNKALPPRSRKILVPRVDAAGEARGRRSLLCGLLFRGLHQHQPRGQHFKQEFGKAEVTKMIKVYGAPIDSADVGGIVQYLATNY